MSARIAVGRRGSLRLPDIPNGTRVADPRDYYDGTWLSPVWALLFGPLYFLRHGFMREAFLVAILIPFFVGLLLSPFLVRSAWGRRAVDRADKVNLETLIKLCWED